MELSDSTFNKILIFSPKKISFIFSKKLFLYFRKWKPWKNFLYFLKRKLFLYFMKQKPLQKKFLIFQETETLKNFLYISREFIRSKKKKKKKLGKCLKFPEIALSFLAPSLKNLIYFRRNFQSMKIKNSLNFFSHFMFAEGELFKHKHKRKAFLISSLYRSNFSN